LLEHTVRESISGSSVAGFYDISNDAAWFEWVETRLLPTIMSEEYFNGDSRSASWGQRFVNTVAMYNTQTVPVRFRQARVKDDSCDTPANSQLARPCWGEFTADRQFKQAFGLDYGNRYLTDLNAIGAGWPQSYGTEAHVVDMPLNASAAVATLRRMQQGLWLNEQTRVVAIESSWYNANLDLSIYSRWQIDISPGGRFTPSVVLHSCRLAPYAGSMDTFRLALEVIFLFMLIYFCVECGYDIRSYKASYFFSVWHWLELVNFGMYLWILVWWLTYLLKDKTPFEVVSTAMYEQRPDLSQVASHFDFMANMAAFNIVFSYMKLFKYLQIFPSFGLLWRTLKMAAGDTWPFLFVFLLFTCGFAFAGHWMFGLMLVEFHSWPRSFVTLFLTMVGGFPYEDIRRVDAFGGAVFTAAWVLVMVMVVVNMFVAILTEWYRLVEEERRTVEERLRRRVGTTARGWPFHDSLRCLPGFRGSGAQGGEADHHAWEVKQLLRRADLRHAEHVREALVSGNSLVAADLLAHFRGDLRTAHDFTQKVQRLAEAEGALGAGEVGGFQERDAIEAKEQEQLRKLQTTVERLEGHLRQLRGALHATSAAPLKEGQSQLGYHVELQGPPLDAGAAEPTAFPLPGAVPER